MNKNTVIDYTHDLTLALISVSTGIELIKLNLRLYQNGLDLADDFWLIVDALEEDLMTIANISSSELIENVNDMFEPIIEYLEFVTGKRSE